MTADKLQRWTIVLFAILTAVPAAAACWAVASLYTLRETPSLLDHGFRLLNDETRRTVVGAFSALIAVVPAWMGRLCYTRRKEGEAVQQQMRFSHTGVAVLTIFVVGAALGLSAYVLLDVPKLEPLATLGAKGLELLKDGARHSFTAAIIYISFFLGVKTWPT